MYSRLLLLACSLSGIALAQTTATLRGRVVDLYGSPIPDCSISLSNLLIGFTSTATAADSGTFQMTNIPLQTYTLTVSRQGFRAAVETVALRSNIPVTLTLTLQLADQITSVEVTAGTAETVDAESTGTRL